MPTIHRTHTGEIFTDNFSVEELRCRCKNCRKAVKHEMEEEALKTHQLIREDLGRGFRPKSAFRCATHHEEEHKDEPGEHNRTAMDYPVHGGVQRGEVVDKALKRGATGIGVAKTFVHVDFREGPLVMWKY